MQPSLRQFLALAAVAASLACSGYSSAPSLTGVEGTYTATAFSTTARGVTTDQLADGVSLTIALTRYGTTTGSLSVPGVPPVSMAGTWRLEGTTVRFTQAAETFVRETPFEFTQGQLHGERASGEISLSVTLSR